MKDLSYKWKGRFCIEISPSPNVLVIFGASGDLVDKKLVPALFNLFTKNLFHEKSLILGCARTKMDDDSFRDKVKKSLVAAVNNINKKQLDDFLKKIYYLSGDYNSDSTYDEILKKVETLEKSMCCNPGRIFYLSIPSMLYSQVVAHLGKSKLTSESVDGVPWRNVVLEKPFGKDIESALKLDRELRAVLHERQIYRIDHYLGKETVQNILMLRFANIIFEPIWNNKYIDNVQITVAESIGIGDRAGYYDQYGHLRDMFQNHLLQLLALVAMEPPTSFAADHVRNEKVKVIEAIKPFPLNELDKYFVRGQYNSGVVAGQPVKGYTEEKNVPEDSKTETFVAAKFFIDNWRWKGVPFYLRSGKRLEKKSSEIIITFKKVPYSIFSPIQSKDLAPNTLRLNIQPEEGLSLSIQAKQPGPKLCMGDAILDFNYVEIFGETKPDAYERLLLDVMLGDQTLFIRSDTIDLSWKLFTPVLEKWESSGTEDLYKYKAGSSGPKEADNLLKQTGSKWYY